MKKTVILFVCILCAMSVWATDYKGTMVMNASSSNGGEEHVNKSDVVVSVEKNANGTYKVTLDDFWFVNKGVTYDVGTLEYDQLVGTTAADGYTYVNGTKQMGVSDIQGYEDLIPENLRKYFTNVGDKKFDVNFAGRFNDDMMIANINTEIKGMTGSFPCIMLWIKLLIFLFKGIIKAPIYELLFQFSYKWVRSQATPFIENL